MLVYLHGLNGQGLNDSSSLIRLTLDSENDQWMNVVAGLWSRAVKVLEDIDGGRVIQS